MTQRFQPASRTYCTPGQQLELLLTLAVAYVLLQLAAPLAVSPADLGLHQRYTAPGALRSPDWLSVIFTHYAWTTAPQDLRALALLRGAGDWLALLGGVGWLALQLVRFGTAWAGALALALWMALAWVLRPFQLPGGVWSGGLALALAVTLLALARSSWRSRPEPAPTPNAWSACVWPGWLLLTGAGCLVLLDFAARGPVLANGMTSWPAKPGARYLGLNQVDGLWLASGLMLVCASARGPMLRACVRLCSTLAVLWQRPRGPIVLLALGGAMSLALGWLGASEHRDMLGIAGLQGGGRPHISGEVLRLLMCGALAWFAYRFAEWRTSAQRLRRGVSHLLIVLMLCVLGLVISDDKGPLLVLALALALLLGAPLLQQVIGWRSRGWLLAARSGAALLLAVGLAMAALGLWRTTLVDWLPRVSTEAAAREALRASPFEARSPNLAQARWLMDATPNQGFGLARVPYCGARALAGQAACTLGSGAPLQMPSDFAFVALVASWGASAATALVFAALLWLCALPAGMLAARQAAGVRNAADSIGLLPVWLVAVPAMVAQAQTVVSVGASLGWSSLTGVTLPLLGYGIVALCALAIAAGLAANPLPLGRAAGRVATMPPVGAGTASWPGVLPAGPFASPVARAAALSMLAFSLTTLALLAQLFVAPPTVAAADRYADPARLARLARGMGWLSQTLLAGAAPHRATVPDCGSGSDAAVLDCRRSRLNDRLAQADPPLQLAASDPDADNMPHVLAATRWLLQYSGTPVSLSALLQRGESAATQSLPDPFRLSGCVRLAGARAPCDATPAAVHALLPHASHLLNSLSRYVAPARGQSPNLQWVRAAPGLDTPITQGRHLTLGLDAAVQDMAQTTAACYSGDRAACDRCRWCNHATADGMFEQARARSIGILVLDARSGAIQATASAYSPCYVRQQRGLPAGPGCPELPNITRPHPERLGNQALEATAKPGSITKIVIALGLQQAGLGAAEAAELPRILTHSRTTELIDITMCKRSGFDPACAERRLRAVADMALALGWNQRADILGAGQLPGLQAQRFSARMLSRHDGSPMLGATTKPRLTRGALQACARQLWRNCRGRDLVDLVAELFGTGEALASPIGVGNALLHLAASARAHAVQDKVAQAHLVTQAQDDSGQDLAVHAVLAPALGHAVSGPVLQGLERTATLGTARSACLAAAAALPGGLLPCRVTADAPGGALLRIAGKTGTPVFSADQGDKKSLPLAQWRAQCAQVRRQLAAQQVGRAGWYALSNEAGKCNMVPSKWYAFLVGAPGGDGWDKVVVVLAERNWNQRSGLVDSPNDNGPNVAAEAGLSFANALYHPSPGALGSGQAALVPPGILP